MYENNTMSIKFIPAFFGGLAVSALAGLVFLWSLQAQEATDETKGEEAEQPRTEEVVEEAEQPLESPCGLVDDDWIEQLLIEDGRFDDVLANAHEHRLQILVGEVVYDPSTQKNCIRYHGYRLNAEYFYPASAIKTVAAVGALLQLQQRQSTDPAFAEVDVDSTLIIDALAVELPPGSGDEIEIVAERVKTTVRAQLRRTLIVSSNTGFNRLYDIVGHADLNQLMWEAGLDSVRVHHRLASQGLPADAHRWAPRIAFRPSKTELELHPERFSDLTLDSELTRYDIGVAHIDEVTGKLVESPLDFSRKNYISLMDLHRIVLDVVDPSLHQEGLGFDLNDEHRALLFDIMSESAGATKKATAKERDSRFKPLVPGVLRLIPDRDQIVYVNKAGRAFGFHLDSAYIRNTNNDKAFFVAVTIHVNSNGIMNDNTYDYRKVSFPFLQNLGEVLTRALLVEE